MSAPSDGRRSGNNGDGNSGRDFTRPPPTGPRASSNSGGGSGSQDYQGQGNQGRGRGGYGSQRGRGGYGSQRGRGGYGSQRGRGNNAAHSVRPEGSFTAGRREQDLRAKQEDKLSNTVLSWNKSRYYPPGDSYVDQAALDTQVGHGRHFALCLLCGGHNFLDGQHEFDYEKCDGRCQHCSTLDHPGKLCSKVWASESWYNRHVGFVPDEDYRPYIHIRPSDAEAIILTRPPFNLRRFDNLRPTKTIERKRKADDEELLDLRSRNNQQEEAIKKHRKRFTEEKQDLQARLDTAQAERGTYRAERDTYRAERDTFATQRDTAVAQRDLARAELARERALQDAEVNRRMAEWLRKWLEDRETQPQNTARLPFSGRSSSLHAENTVSQSVKVEDADLEGQDEYRQMARAVSPRTAERYVAEEHAQREREGSSEDDMDIEFRRSGGKMED